MKNEGPNVINSALVSTKVPYRKGETSCLEGFDKMDVDSYCSTHPLLVLGWVLLEGWTHIPQPHTELSRLMSDQINIW